ncbi:uncharacterized protein LOC143276823 [Babylonia areolata]|uniref:uncharacterized protein LOC143276823 n=1 Tax=Babylonia areolata TaxID=304850 RepID=UPI003FD392C2
MTSLIMDHNHLSLIGPHAFTNSSLLAFQLSSNLLRRFPGEALKTLPRQIGALYLSDNLIATIGSGEASGLNIRSLNLANNPMKTVEAGAFTGTSVSGVFDLRGTELTSLPADVDPALSAGTRLSLAGLVGWECGCDSLWLSQFLSGSAGSSEPTCGSTGRGMGDSLGDIENLSSYQHNSYYNHRDNSHDTYHHYHPCYTNDCFNYHHHHLHIAILSHTFNTQHANNNYDNSNKGTKHFHTFSVSNPNHRNCGGDHGAGCLFRAQQHSGTASHHHDHHCAKFEQFQNQYPRYPDNTDIAINVHAASDDDDHHHSYASEDRISFNTNDVVFPADFNAFRCSHDSLYPSRAVISLSKHFVDVPSHHHHHHHHLSTTPSHPTSPPSSNNNNNDNNNDNNSDDGIDTAELGLIVGTAMATSVALTAMVLAICVIRMVKNAMTQAAGQTTASSNTGKLKDVEKGQKANSDQRLDPETPRPRSDQNADNALQSDAFFQSSSPAQNGLPPYSSRPPPFPRPVWMPKRVNPA